MFDKNQLIGKIAQGEYPTKKEKTVYGEFELEFPSGESVQLIARKKASYCGGLPLNSYGISDQMRFDVDATLAVVIKSYPAEFPEKWEGDGIVGFPDLEVKNALFKAFNTFYDKTQKGLSGQS
jgi:hypothetical protein